MIDERTPGARAFQASDDADGLRSAERLALHVRRDRRRQGVRPLFRGALTLLAAATLAAQPAPQPIEVGSPTLKAGERVPRDYTPDGRNVSPPLTWSRLPGGTRELAVICEDPDAGNPPPFTHWVVYKIPATATGLPEGLPIDPAVAMPAEIAGAVQGVSGFRRPIYRGPAPPPGTAHHYHFVVYALDANLDLKPGLNRAELLSAIQGHVIGKGELVAIYER